MVVPGSLRYNYFHLRVCKELHSLHSSLMQCHTLWVVLGQKNPKKIEKNIKKRSLPADKDRDTPYLLDSKARWGDADRRCRRREVGSPNHLGLFRERSEQRTIGIFFGRWRTTCLLGDVGQCVATILEERDMTRISWDPCMFLYKFFLG
jgi:hypothetical protein